MTYTIEKAAVIGSGVMGPVSQNRGLPRENDHCQLQYFRHFSEKNGGRPFSQFCPPFFGHPLF